MCSSADDDPTDYLFWADPFDAHDRRSRPQSRRPRQLRLDAEAYCAICARPTPPLHATLRACMALAARRYDALGRRFEIGAEANATTTTRAQSRRRDEDGLVYRGLNVAKYSVLGAARRSARDRAVISCAWTYESRPAALGAVLTRFHLGEQQATIDADRLNAAEREDYFRKKTLPTFEAALGRAR